MEVQKIIAQGHVAAGERTVEVEKDMRLAGLRRQSAALVDPEEVDGVALQLNGLVDIALREKDIGGWPARAEAGER